MANFNCNIDEFSLGMCKKKFNELNKENIEYGRAFINSCCKEEPYRVNYISMGISGYEMVSTVMASKNPEFEFELRYMVYASKESVSRMDDVGYKTLEEATNVAKRLSIKNRKDYDISKKYINVSEDSSDIVSEVRLSVETVIDKPTILEYNKKKINKIYTYMFYWNV